MAKLLIMEKYLIKLETKKGWNKKLQGKKERGVFTFLQLHTTEGIGIEELLTKVLFKVFSAT